MLSSGVPATPSTKPAPSFEVLTAALRRGSALERTEAARGLRAWGNGALPALCAALRDPCVPVRLAAAESLGEIGEPDAIPALSRALRTCFTGGSARRQLANGFVGMVLLGIALLLLTVLNPLAIVEGGLRLGWDKLWNWRKPAPEPEPSSRAPVYALALARIAEQHPTPELRALLPELRAAGLDLLNVDRETRHVSRETAGRIDRLTARLMALPIPTSKAAVENHSLPIPASARRP